MSTLVVEKLDVFYGAIHALKGVSFHVDKGEIVTLIGANGAGKSTILKTISGLIKPARGSIAYGGQDLSAIPAHRLVDVGISQVPEGRRVFANLTVLDNLEMGAYRRRDAKGVAEDLDWVFEMFPVLKERRRQLAGTLSGGEQQMLAMGRGLMSKPELMLLDEPSMGLAPMLVREIFDIIVRINATGTSILLVEQNAIMALAIADRAYVLETGTIALEGTASELAKDTRVRQVYLGMETA
ncbi:MAG: High-affinity branched-chain amino acid transport ATP-binding protein LivF [Firmicutes bacterium ADurb.Bin506]|jgi:branched-chain amino acid transport system ATP-binding protein|nr:MAG: High-affinity branched-chain amino acid transport ATP-binding protein LivF [Firmicutes bacterium ADurb.Bin506]